MHLHHDGGQASQWKRALDVHSRHAELDFSGLRRAGVAAVIVRAGRGTRQDERWIEHVAAAARAGLALGSYWHIYPSRATAYRQAELWGAAVRAADAPFPAGHWADLTVAEGLSPDELGLYLDRMVRRMDALTDATTGVFTDASFWSGSVRLSCADRPLWLSAASTETSTETGTESLASPHGLNTPQRPDSRHLRGVCLAPCTTETPGEHQFRLAGGERSLPDDPDSPRLELVPRGPDESVEAWRARWTRAPEVSELQHKLNDMGANIVQDGIFGPATDAALAIFETLQRRDSASGDAPQHPEETP